MNKKLKITLIILAVLIILVIPIKSTKDDGGTVVYNSTQEAADSVNIKDRSLISRCCKGTRKTTGGYHWKYYNSSTLPE